MSLGKQLSGTWSCQYTTTLGTYYASSFLSDTSILNPAITQLVDTLTFTLELTDAVENLE
jgi:hypothetical protein